MIPSVVCYYRYAITYIHFTNLYPSNSFQYYFFCQHAHYYYYYYFVTKETYPRFSLKKKKSLKVMIVNSFNSQLSLNTLKKLNAMKDGYFSSNKNIEKN